MIAYGLIWREHTSSQRPIGPISYGTSGGVLDVALMEYSVEEVVEEAMGSFAIANPFCYPTFLDVKPNSQFFPTPNELPAGAPMALFQIWSDEQIFAEMLHTRLAYKRRHIVKLGKITTNAPLVALKALRDNHLAALQLSADRDDFGKEL